MVFLGDFQKFDHGEELIQSEPGLDVSAGDTFYWVCAQFDGLATVVSYKDGTLRFKKLY